ncbi:DUF1525 domain-containing protein [Morganella sp. B601]
MAEVRQGGEACQLGIQKVPVVVFDDRVVVYVTIDIRQTS